MDKWFPFFHYSILDNLDNILQGKVIRARKYLPRNKYRDISIDPSQGLRDKLGLTRYIPLYVGFHSFLRSYDFNGYLMRIESPKIANIRFFGSLSKDLRTKILKDDYEKTIIFMIRGDTVLNFADKGKLRMFTDIAIKNDSQEIDITNRNELIQAISNTINANNQTCCEVDVLDDGKELLGFPEDIESIIVDNRKIRKAIETKISKILGKDILQRLLIFASPLPRKDISDI